MLCSVIRHAIFPTQCYCSILLLQVDCSSYIGNGGSIAVEGGHTSRITTCPREHEYLCGPDHRTYVGPCALCRSMDRLHKLGRYQKTRIYILVSQGLRSIFLFFTLGRFSKIWGLQMQPYDQTKLPLNIKENAQEQPPWCTTQ